MRRLFVLCSAAAVALLACGQARGQDDDYLRIYGMIQEGDGLGHSGQFTEAREKYLQAQAMLQQVVTAVVQQAVAAR